MLNIRVQSITNWPGKINDDPRWSPFRKTYKDTIKLLEYELSKADAQFSSLILQMFVEPRMIRLDGQLRADAKVLRPGVIFSFTRLRNIHCNPQTGKMQGTPQHVNFPCDAFTDWQDNLRAIALSMERLRHVERYGVFKYDDIVSRLALPTADGKQTTREEAAAFLAVHSGLAMADILVDPDVRQSAYRKAARELHPDRGGSIATFARLQEANIQLGG